MNRRHSPSDPIATVLGPLRADLALAALEAGVQLHRVDARCWAVSSSHQGREGYHVTRTPDDLGYECTCQAGANGRECRHAAIVMLVEATGAVEAILPPLPAGDVSWDRAVPRTPYHPFHEEGAYERGSW